MPIDPLVELTELDLTPAPISPVDEPPVDAAFPTVETQTSASDDRAVFYASLAAEEADHLTAAAARIVAARSAIGKNMLLIGRELIPIKARMAGRFEEWLRLEFSMSRATAYHYINVATEFEDVPAIIESLPATTVYKLAATTTPAEVRDAVVREISAGEPVSAEDVEARIAYAKAGRAKASGEKHGKAKLKKHQSANDDAKVTDKDVAGSANNKVTSMRLPINLVHSGGEPDPALQQNTGAVGSAQDRAEQSAHETFASLRHHLPADEMQILQACASSDAAWNALGRVLTSGTELDAAA